MDTVDQAFNEIHRENFVPESIRDQAYIDAPLPIGYGQTISQPSTVRSMLKWLDARAGEKIMDVGSGSGWTTALLSHIVGQKGKIYAVELIPQLVKFGRDNCTAIGVKNAEFFQAGKAYGLPDLAPFDRILVSASANELPLELLTQLKTGGKLIIPVRENILEITKISENDSKTITHPGYIFVPLLKG